jgi:uncharacterized protein (TIGR03435 family)
MPALVPTALALFAACLAYGQDNSFTFEVASVKPATPPVPNAQGMMIFRAPSGGPGTKDPGRINYPNMSLKGLLMTAYDVKNYQIDGPAWLDTERFDVNATMPPDTTKEQFRIMLQNLLAERFKLKVHRDSKELPMYSLVVAKNGPKMKESVETPASEDRDRTPPQPPLPLGGPKIGPDGFPILSVPPGGRGGMSMAMMPGRARIMAVKQTMQDLAQRLSGQLNRPVTDATGLTAKYDFTLTYATEGTTGLGAFMTAGGAPPPPPAGGGPAGVSAPGLAETDPLPNLFGAVQAQLGLKLDAKKGPVETIVVDHVEKTPIEN